MKEITVIIAPNYSLTKEEEESIDPSTFWLPIENSEVEEGVCIKILLKRIDGTEEILTTTKNKVY